MREMNQLREVLREADPLIKRLESLIQLRDGTPEEEYPLKSRILGFPVLEVENKAEVESRINELKDILAVKER